MAKTEPGSHSGRTGLSQWFRSATWIVATLIGIAIARLLGLVELAALSIAVLVAIIVDGTWFYAGIRRRPAATAQLPMESVPSGAGAHAVITVVNQLDRGTTQPAEIHWHSSTTRSLDDVTSSNKGVLGVGRCHPGDSIVVTHPLNTRYRGTTSISGTALLIRSPLRIWWKRWSIAPDRTVLIWPRIHPLNLDQGPPTDGLSEERPPISVVSEPDGELVGLRPYVRGDDIRMIHWRTSARRDHPHVVQTEPPRTHDGIRIRLDTRIGPGDEEGSLEDFERCLSAAASVINHFSGRGMRLELVTPLERVDGGPGELLDHLALAHPVTEVSADHFGGSEKYDLAISCNRSVPDPTGCPTIACWTPETVSPGGIPQNAPQHHDPHAITVHWLRGEPLHETWLRLISVAEAAGPNLVGRQ